MKWKLLTLIHCALAGAAGAIERARRAVEAARTRANLAEINKLPRSNFEIRISGRRA